LLETPNALVAVNTMLLESVDVGVPVRIPVVELRESPYVAKLNVVE
jgi:hypothetical protein